MPAAATKNAKELMELAVEAAQCRDLPDFLEQFAVRSARMLGALWGGVAVHLGRETEFYGMPSGPGSACREAEQWVIGKAEQTRSEMEVQSLPKEI